MDRILVYPQETPRSNDILQAEKNALYSLAFLSRAALGGNTNVHGLACTPTAPASLSVQVGQGSIYTLTEADATAYGGLGTDTNSILKQGMLSSTATIAITPPSTSGFSQIFLVQVQYQDIDAGSTVLNYYNSANPQQPLSGPNGSNTPQFTLRTGALVVQLKAGTASGSPTAPTADGGWTGLYLITVANGQSTITSGNIAQIAAAPFISLNLPAVPAAIQAQAGNYFVDGGTANALTITAPAYTPGTLPTGTPLRIKKSASANTGACTVTVNGGSPITLQWADGSSLAAADWPANAIGEAVFDGTVLQFIGLLGPKVFARATATRTRLSTGTSIYINSSTGNDSNPGTSGAPFQTLQAAATYAQANFDLNGENIAFVATGSFSANCQINGLFVGQLNAASIIFNLAAASVSCANSCFIGAYGAQFTISSGSLASSGSGNNQGCGIEALSNSIINHSGSNFGVCTVAHTYSSASGNVFAIGAYTISGSAPYHAQTLFGQINTLATAFTITLTGTPAFTDFANVYGGFIDFHDCVFSGSATGARYVVDGYGTLDIGAVTLPGSSAGTLTAGKVI